MDIIFIAIIVFFSMLLLLLFAYGFLFIILIFTPAGVWMAAKFTRKPIICMHSKDGMTTRFVRAKALLGNFAEIKGHGLVELAKDTANLDTKGKLIWYNAIMGNAKTQQLYKAALIKELKDVGFKIESWADLKKIFEMSNNKEETIKRWAELKKTSAEKAEKFKVLIRNIVRGTTQIVWDKTYKFSVLYNLFSNDYNSAEVVTAIRTAVNEDRKNREKNWIAIIIIILILLIVGAIAYTIIKSSQGPTEVILNVAPGMIKNGTTLVG